MQNKIDIHKKPSRKKYIIFSVLTSVLIITTVSFILHTQEQPNPASEKVIREAVAKTLRKDPNDLTEDDFSSIIVFTLYNKEISDIKLLEKFTNLKELSIILPKNWAHS